MIVLTPIIIYQVLSVAVYNHYKRIYHASKQKKLVFHVLSIGIALGSLVLFTRSSVLISY